MLKGFFYAEVSTIISSDNSNIFQKQKHITETPHRIFQNSDIKENL